MSLWQYHACLDGWNRAHDPDADKKLTDDEVEALYEMAIEG